MQELERRFKTFVGVLALTAGAAVVSASPAAAGTVLSTTSTSTSSTTSTSESTATSTSSTTSTSGASTTSTTLVRMLHFQCYEIVPPGAFARTGVTLVDPFGTRTVDLRRAFTLCAPADKNEEDSTAPDDPGHLTSYGIHGPKAARIRGLRVVNQFGDLSVDLVKPARLLVPTAKSLAGPPASPAPGLLDHFACYKVRRSAQTPRFAMQTGVRVSTQFETGATVDVVKPLRLCLAVDKNGEAPGAENHPDALLCYRVRSTGGLPRTLVSLNNQFGPQDYVIRQRREFCAPSVVSQTPVTTSTTATTTTSIASTLSSSTSTSSTSTTSSCTPASCTGSDCGPKDDGCGETIDCPCATCELTCNSGDSSSGGACVSPDSCAALCNINSPECSDFCEFRDGCAQTMCVPCGGD